jgi:hypothetical protein
MANSTLPGPQGAQPHHRRHLRHTAAVPQKPLTAPKTPGIQGHKDQADPNFTSMLGCTPNLTGVRDWADHTLGEISHLWHQALGSIGLDKETGTPMANGSTPLAAPSGQLTIDEAHLLALKITTCFEGASGKSMDYKSLAGTDDQRNKNPNFDRQATSFGLVQWNFGTGTLSKLLNKMRANNANVFDGCFTAGSNFDVLKAALALSGDKGAAAASKWARDLYATAAGKKEWQTSFENLAKVEAFNKIQFDSAINDYNPTVEKNIKWLRTFAPALMAKVEFRTYAALFDCAIQQGGLSRAADEIKAKADRDKPKTQFDLMTMAFTERANKAVEESRADCMSRRLSILNGKMLSFTVCGVTRKRENSQYGIVLTEAAKIIVGL